MVLVGKDGRRVESDPRREIRCPLLSLAKGPLSTSGPTSSRIYNVKWGVDLKKIDRAGVVVS